MLLPPPQLALDLVAARRRLALGVIYRPIDLTLGVGRAMPSSYGHPDGSRLVYCPVHVSLRVGLRGLAWELRGVVHRPVHVALGLGQAEPARVVGTLPPISKPATSRMALSL